MTEKKKLIETCTVQNLAQALKLHPYTIRRFCRGGNGGLTLER